MLNFRHESILCFYSAVRRLIMRVRITIKYEHVPNFQQQYRIFTLIRLHLSTVYRNFERQMVSCNGNGITYSSSRCNPTRARETGEQETNLISIPLA